MDKHMVLAQSFISTISSFHLFFIILFSQKIIKADAFDLIKCILPFWKAISTRHTSY